MNDLNDISAMPAYGLAALLGLALVVDLRHDLCRLVSGRNVVLAAIGAWYLLEAIMLPEQLRSLYNQEQYNLGIFHVGLAFTGFLVGYHFTTGCGVFPYLGEKITFFNDEVWLWRLILIGAFIGFAPILFFTGTQFGVMLEGMMGQRATWGGLLARGRYGGVRDAFLMLEMFIGGVAPFAAILLFSRNGTFGQRLFCILVVVWPLARGYGSGTRSSMILAVGSLVAVFYWKAAPALRKKMICVGLASLPLLYGLMAAMVISRASGNFNWEDREQATYVGNEMLRELLFITSKVPATANYAFGHSYYVQLVNPIPRFLWPDKPTGDAGLILAAMYGAVDASGEATLTVSPGLIGEMYMNFGVLGIFGLSLFGGWLVKGWDQIAKLYSHSLPAMMFYSGGLGVLFIMGRSFTMNMFYGLLSLAVLAWVIRYLNPHAVANNSVLSPPQPGA